MAMKTPGVYIVEKSAFPNSVVQVATAVPAFIGYTEKAMNGNVPLWNTPHRITTFSDYAAKFGGAPRPIFDLKPFKERTKNPYADGADPAAAAMLPQAEFTVIGPRGPEKYELIQTNTAYSLYSAMRMFFLNGGGTCYITAIGDYTAPIDSEAMLRGIKGLEKEPEVTMVVIPETTRLNRQNAAKVQQAMLAHCGAEMRNRFSILDVHGGYLELDGPRGKPVKCFRGDVGTKALDYGAAYYPWLDSAVFQNRDFTFENVEITSRKLLISLLKRSVSMDKEITPEILKVGKAEVKGDLTISVTAGGTVKLLPKDLKAEDDQADAIDLIYKVVGASDNMNEDDRAMLTGAMAGTLVRGAAKTKPIYTFSQAEIDDGTISFIHSVDGEMQGSFGVIVTDNEDVQTGEKKISVVVGNSVIAKASIEAGAEISLTLTDDMDPGSVKFVDADPIDKSAVYKDDPDVQTAQKALTDAPSSTPELKKAVTDAQVKAVISVEGKTRSLPGIGTWTAAGDKVTFAANPTFKGAEVAVQYITSKGEVASKRNDLKILVDEVVSTDDTPDDMAKTIDKTMRAIVPLYTDVMLSLIHI